jgi:GDP-L-fucose synthase
MGDPVPARTARLRRKKPKPDGPPRKLMDSSRLNALGWRPKTALEDGVAEVYRWFVREKAGERATARSGQP